MHITLDLLYVVGEDMGCIPCSHSHNFLSTFILVRWVPNLQQLLVCQEQETLCLLALSISQETEQLEYGLDLGRSLMIY